MNPVPLPEIAAGELAYETFICDYYNADRPLVIRGLVADWPALSRWNRAYFEQRFGERMVAIDHSNNGFLTYTDLDGSGNAQRSELPFRQAAEEINQPQAGRRCYLRNTSIPDQFPELLADFSVPALLREPWRVTMNHFWYGAPGCISALHHDWPNNFLAQVSGHKQVTLFNPADTPYLYPAESGPVQPGDWIDLREHSQVDPEQPDYQRFPLLQQAQPYTAVLAAGDVLWLPSSWWHQMHALDVSVSVNFWWLPHLEQILFMDSMVSRMPAVYQAGLLLEFLHRGTEMRNFASPAAMAECALQLGKAWAAVLLAATQLDQVGQSRYGALIETALHRDDSQLDPAAVADLLAAVRPATNP